MTRQTESKQERIVEAVRQGLKEVQVVDFVHESGFALTDGALERHLRRLGGLPRVLELLDDGLSNVEVLEECLPERSLKDLKVKLQLKESAQAGTRSGGDVDADDDAPIYATTKITLTLPSDLYEAIRAAAHAEMKSQNQLIVEILTGGLSHRPRPAR